LHAQKMEAIGKLSAGIAHDFNNMLTSIKGFTQLALVSISENDPIRVYLQNVLDSSEKAEKMIKQLLAFSRKQVLEKKVININELVKEMESLIKRLIGEDIILTLNLSADTGLVEADPIQIENVIVELVVNARDAMPDGGKIIIETTNFEVDEEFMKSHEGAQIGQYVMLSIKDTGFGIPDEIKDRIFEPFFTTKEKGTGLGLSTVFGIVKQHGGNIWCESEIGRGTTFKILLPRIEKEIIEKIEGKLLKGHETVLVIDDDEKVRAIVLEMLKRLGYKTLEAPNPDIALFLAQFHNNSIDLVISDVVMPGMGAVKLFHEIKRYRPDTEVLYMSGYTDDVILRHGVMEKGIDFIQKPFTIQTLSRKIREVFDKEG
ncbi:MAG: ATP-binding protein, partial [Thermodesulfovibrionales bacterium]|nr:ATP-binding protein [Thermodesulfovibrionales bacterium]